MNALMTRLFICMLIAMPVLNFGQAVNQVSVTIPFFLDHNRMLIEAEIQKQDGTWRRVRLWVDSGNPEFFISETLALDLGIDLSGYRNSGSNSPKFPIPHKLNLQIGGKAIDFEGVPVNVQFRPYWLFSTMHSDGNLPSSVLKKYHIVFDYPENLVTIANPGSTKPQGIPSHASVRPETGVLQLDAVIDGDSLSFAFDNGASYSFISEEILTRLLRANPGWDYVTGTSGCPNMWGWWPKGEQDFTVARIPEMLWGNAYFNDFGIVGVTRSGPGSPAFGDWYSQKTARCVDGLIGTNAIKLFRVEIDYSTSIVYFEKTAARDTCEMDLVGISVRQLPDSSYQVAGIVKKEGIPFTEGIEAGDMLLMVDDLTAKGATMGTVVNALRGKPGEIRRLKIERNGTIIMIDARVKHLL